MLLSYRSMIPMFRETKLVGQSPVIPTWTFTILSKWWNLFESQKTIERSTTFDIYWKAEWSTVTTNSEVLHYPDRQSWIASENKSNCKFLSTVIGQEFFLVLWFKIIQCEFYLGHISSISSFFFCRVSWVLHRLNLFLDVSYHQP